MSKKSKEADVNLYYMKDGQDSNKKDIKEMMKKKKEREKRIKKSKEQNKEESFDLETETVIQMTNKNKMKKEEEEKKKINKRERKRQKRIKKIKFVLKVLLLLGIIVGAIVFAMTSPIFNIKEIQVKQNSIVPSDTIISLSNIKIDENIFRFSSNVTQKQIKENPYIENVKINRKIPSTIEIEVEERVPKYSVSFMGKYAYINTQGYILEISENSNSLLIIEGISTPEEEIVPGKRLQDEDLEKLETIIKITNIAKDNELDSKVTSIDITNKNEYSIYLEEEQKRAYIGDESNLNTKILYIKDIMEREAGKAGDIYVNGDLNDNFKTYFKEKVNM